jgi:superfamily II DNA/RNA helicase
MNFNDLSLRPELVRAAQDVGFAQPTAIQTLAIPEVLRGVDLLARAQTGSGKTAAFALPLLADWMNRGIPISPRRVHTLVLVPTRELAAQVGEVFRSLAQHLPWRIKVVTAFGGVSINPQLMALRGGADVLVATPGRLLDLHAHNALRLQHLQALVLDEADRLLDLGFAEELQRVLALLPAQRQNLFFSATFAPDVLTLAQSLLREPVRVEVDATPEQAPQIVQRAIAVDAAQRTPLLRHLLKTEKWESTLVFVASQYAAEHLANKLYQSGFVATAFHGGLSQGARQTVLQEFKQARWDVLVTTDLAARGIDVADLSAVVNYDLPRSPNDHIHRIGRTARAGRSGVAVSFVSADTEAHFRLIEKRQGLPVPREQIQGFEPKDLPTPNTGLEGDKGGIKGKRPSKKDKLRASGKTT